MSLLYIQQMFENDILLVKYAAKIVFKICIFYYIEKLRIEKKEMKEHYQNTVLEKTLKT